MFLHKLGVFILCFLNVPRRILGIGTVGKMGDGNGGVIGGEGVDDVTITFSQLEFLKSGQTSIIDGYSGRLKGTQIMGGEECTMS